MLSTVLIRGESPAASACGASNCCYSRTDVENAHEANLASNENDSLEYSVRPGRNRWGGGARSRCGPCFSSGPGRNWRKGPGTMRLQKKAYLCATSPKSLAAA